MLRIVGGDPDQAGAQYQGQRIDLAKYQHAGGAAGQQRHTNRQQADQHPHAAEGQQQQQQGAEGGAAANQADLAGGLGLPGCRIQHATGRQQLTSGCFDLCTGSGDLGGYQRRLLHIKGAAFGACTQQGPGHARFFQQQCAAAQVGLDAAAGVQRLLRA